MRGAIVSALAGLVIAGCVSTREMPLAPNVVRLDTEARGALFTDQATSQTMRKAAEATLRRGFTHFRLEEASLTHGSEFSGAVVRNIGGSSVTRSSHRHGRTITATYTRPAATFVTPTRIPTASVGVTVIMFHADEPEAREAFDAVQVMREHQ